MRYGLLTASIAVCVFGAVAQGQEPGGDYLKHSLSGGFLASVKAGPNNYLLNDALGFSVNYFYRPRRWLALEGGLEQVVRPIGSSVCCRYARNANDELYLVPFGARYIWEPRGNRVRLTIGAGGAYLKYTVGRETPDSRYPFSGWGGQFVLSGDYGLTRSGRLRVGMAGRYYYASPRASLPPSTYSPG